MKINQDFYEILETPFLVDAVKVPQNEDRLFKLKYINIM